MLRERKGRQDKLNEKATDVIYLGESFTSFQGNKKQCYPMSVHGLGKGMET